MSDPKSILQQADELINGDRQNDYGSPKGNFQRIADLWGMVLGVPVTTEQVALCMVGLKFARLCSTPSHTDSWKDIAGYVGCWEMVK